MKSSQDPLTEQEKKIKAIKRKNLQNILGNIKTEKAKLYEIGKKWWNGEEISLRDKEEFYHTRLFEKTLEAKKVEYFKRKQGIYGDERKRDYMRLF